MFLRAITSYCFIALFSLLFTAEGLVAQAQEQKVIFCPDSVRGNPPLGNATSCALVNGCKRDEECSLLNGNRWSIVSSTQREIPSGTCICIGSQYVIQERLSLIPPVIDTKRSEEESTLRVEWFGLSLFLSLIVGAYLLRKRQVLVTFKCPECAERIKMDALKCRFCGSSLSLSGSGSVKPGGQGVDSNSASLLNKLSINIRAIIAVCIVVFLTPAVPALLSNVRVFLSTSSFFQVDCNKLSGADFINCKAEERAK